MCGNLLCQFLIDNMYLLSVNRRRITMIMSESNNALRRVSSTRSTSGYLSAIHLGLAPEGVARIVEIPLYKAYQ